MRVIVLKIAFVLSVGLATAFAPSSIIIHTTPTNNPTTAAATTTTRLDAATSHTCDVAVFGGGFGGLYTALAIARDAAKLQQQHGGKKIDIALIDDSDSFIFLPLLYDLTVGTATEAEVCPKYKDLLEGTGIRHLQTSLESMENDHQAILKGTDCNELINFSACVVSVGASPKSILSSVPGATEYAQPFYTKPDAKATEGLLSRLEQQDKEQRIAVVGGGFGGVELAAAIQRRIPKAAVSLLSRGVPMAGTRAEPLVNQALVKLGVTIEDCSVDEIAAAASNGQYIVKRNCNNTPIEDAAAWDAVLWTAGSGPAYPVSEGLDVLRKSGSGRLEIDTSLRCFWMAQDGTSQPKPNIWALGDCAEVAVKKGQPAIPKTAQAAMQQSDVVAANLLAQLDAPVNRIVAGKEFAYQDLGSMIMLGGPNAAVMAPRQGPFDVLFAPTLDSVGEVLGAADQVIAAISGSTPLAEKMGLSPDALGLSLGSHGLGVDSGSAPGTLAGTLAGAARRAVYSARMPTNRQRAVSAFSAAISTATALAKEVNERSK